jgi:hypothetical protein
MKKQMLTFNAEQQKLLQLAENFSVIYLENLMVFALIFVAQC